MRQAISPKMHSQFRIIGSVLCWFRCLQHPPLALLCKVFWFLISPQDTFSDIRIWMNLLPKKLQLCPFPAFWDCQRSQFWGEWVGLCCCRGCECYWTSYRFSTSAVGSGGGSLQSRQGTLRESIGIRFGKRWRCHQSEIKPQVSSEYIFLGCNRWDQNLQGSDPAIFQGNPSEVKDYFAVRSTIGLREGLGRHGMNALMGSNVEVLAVFLCRFVSSLQKIDENSWVQR